MIPKTDVGKLLELYKSTNKQTDELLEIIRIVSDNNQKNTDLIQRQTDLIEYLNNEVLNLKAKIRELEEEVKELRRCC